MECRRTLALDPNLLAMYGNLARMLVDRGQPDEAISLLGKALQIKADQPHVRYNLGLVLCQQGRLAEAMEQWAEVLRWHPENTEALNQLAWVRATAPEASVRDGAKAVEMAQHAVKLTDGQEPNLLDTLAAAQAEAGQFGEAVENRQARFGLGLRSRRHSVGRRHPSPHQALRSWDSLPRNPTTVAATVAGPRRGFPMFDSLSPC